MSDKINLLILVKPWFGEKYRGTDRYAPDYFAGLESESRIYKLWLKYIERNVTDEYCHDLEAVKELVANYGDDSMPIEIVEVVENGGQPKAGKVLFGYDVSNIGDISIIQLYLNPTHKLKLPLVADSLSNPEEPGEVIWGLIQAYFCPKLNENILFPDYETAKQCENCVTALDNLFPDDVKYQDYGAPFEAVGLYLVE